MPLKKNPCLKSLKTVSCLWEVHHFHFPRQSLQQDLNHSLRSWSPPNPKSSSNRLSSTSHNSQLLLRAVDPPHASRSTQKRGPKTHARKQHNKRESSGSRVSFPNTALPVRSSLEVLVIACSFTSTIVLLTFQPSRNSSTLTIAPPNSPLV